MKTIIIYTKLKREELRNILSALPAMFSGRAPDPTGMVHGFKARLSSAFFSKVKAAFVTKARGGTDECGDSWPPLSKEYLAYGRRFGKGEQAALKKAAGLGKGHRHAPGEQKGLLTVNQLQRWNQVFARNMKWLEPLYGERKAKNLAAAIAWKDAKAHGAKTKLEVFGNRQVEILHDTGVLFNSLSPGVVTGTGADASYIPATNQIAEDRPGKLIVGTTVKYAAAHQNPKRKGGVQRKILPDPASVPDSWLRYFADTATSGFVAAIHMIARGGK